MPSYDFNCHECKKEFSIYLTIKELDAQPKIRCPHCESDNVEKKITSFFAKTSKKS